MKPNKRFTRYSLEEIHTENHPVDVATRVVELFPLFQRCGTAFEDGVYGACAGRRHLLNPVQLPRNDRPRLTVNASCYFRSAIALRIALSTLITSLEGL